MCKILCLLTLSFLSFNNVLAWDFAMTSEDKIEFYSNGIQISKEGEHFVKLTSITFDAVSNIIYFVDEQEDGASIYSYNVATKKFEQIIKNASNYSIQGIAFDPVHRILFWTDTVEKSISWISLEIGPNKTRPKNVLVTMGDDVPAGIAVDSCRGYIYWTNVNIAKPTIERSRFNGSEREIIIDSDITQPVSIAIDQKTQTLYWADDKEGIHFEIQSSDLDGKNRKIVYKDINHQPKSLTVSNSSVYWIDWSYKSVWKINKGVRDNPKTISNFNENPFGIVANYNIEDQLKGIEHCEALKSLPHNTSVSTESYGIPVHDDFYCVNGDKEKSKSCKCWPGYTGKRCEVFVCHNYCIHGDCNLTNGQPQCRCKKGFIGTRCEIQLCHNYCLNGGVCKIDDNENPTCLCADKFEGLRCELNSVLHTISSASPTVLAESQNSSEKNITAPTQIPQKIKNATEPSNEEQDTVVTKDSTREQDNTFDMASIEAFCSTEWDPIRDSVIIVLAVLCGVMSVIIALLFKKILHLKRRPRIKKRIIVNKNVTPLTARPDQCEITIEDCCNMNICETPCFEPRRPPLNSKIGKDDKMNLIANMEHPDDLF